MPLTLLLLSAALADTPPEAPARTEGRVGLRAGAWIPLDALRPGITPGVEAGASLPWWGARLRPYVALDYGRGSAQVTGEDDRLDAAWSVDVELHTWALSGGLDLRLLSWREAISPTLRFGGGWLFTTVRASGEDLLPAGEQQSGPAWTVGAGLDGRVGPGWLGGGLHLTAGRLDGVLTGALPYRILQPTVAYHVAI